MSAIEVSLDSEEFCNLWKISISSATKVSFYSEEFAESRIRSRELIRTGIVNMLVPMGLSFRSLWEPD